MQGKEFIAPKHEISYVYRHYGRGLWLFSSICLPSIFFQQKKPNKRDIWYKVFKFTVSHLSNAKKS